MSLDEILDFLDCYVRKSERRMKEKLSCYHFLARDMAQQIGMLFTDSEEAIAPELWDYFPELFAEEKISADKRKHEQEMAVYKAQMRDYMYRHNHARNGGEK